MGGACRPTEKVAIKFAIIIHITKHLPRYRHKKKRPTDAAMDCRRGVSNTPNKDVAAMTCEACEAEPQGEAYSPG